MLSKYAFVLNEVRFQKTFVVDTLVLNFNLLFQTSVFTSPKSRKEVRILGFSNLMGLCLHKDDEIMSKQNFLYDKLVLVKVVYIRNYLCRLSI
jgi:hypothetical protein